MLDPRDIEFMDPQMASILRAKSGAQRQAIAADMFDLACDLIRARLKEDHPEWSMAQIDKEVASRISQGKFD